MSADGTDDTGRLVAAGYDEAAERYAALEAPEVPWPRAERLRDLLRRVPDGAPVLDAGCGNGIPALQLISERHQATGVEISTTQAALARRNAPQARVIRAGLADVAFPAGTFAAIAALYVIDHLPREEHDELFRRFAEWLQPGGYLLFTVEPYDEPGDVREWEGVPMFFSQFDPEATLRLVEEAGFAVLSHDVRAQLEGGRPVEFLWVLAQNG
jgi:cyclopropane fatty-acyl-phospholipid synthase-like methyltransferase